MRVVPSLDQVSGTNYYSLLSNNTGFNFDDFTLSNGNSTNKFVRLNNTQNFSATANGSGWFKTVNTDAYVALDAEL